MPLCVLCVLCGESSYERRHPTQPRRPHPGQAAPARLPGADRGRRPRRGAAGPPQDGAGHRRSAHRPRPAGAAGARRGGGRGIEEDGPYAAGGQPLMPRSDPAAWSDLMRQALGRYDEPLLRQVAAKLVRSRNQWPAEELVERAVATADNAAVIDRRLRDLEPPARQLLALLAHSRQPHWRLGNLVELAVALGQREEPFRPILALFENGL